MKPYITVVIKNWGNSIGNNISNNNINVCNRINKNINKKINVQYYLVITLCRLSAKQTITLSVFVRNQTNGLDSRCRYDRK